MTKAFLYHFIHPQFFPWIQSMFCSCLPGILLLLVLQRSNTFWAVICTSTPLCFAHWWSVWCRQGVMQVPTSHYAHCLCWMDEELLGEGEGMDQRCMCLGRDSCVFVHTRVTICGPKSYSDTWNCPVIYMSIIDTLEEPSNQRGSLFFFSFFQHMCRHRRRPLLENMKGRVKQSRNGRGSVIKD